MAAYASPPGARASQIGAHPDSLRANSAGSGPRPRSLPHIKDIQAAAVPEIPQDAGLNALLAKAEDYIQSARRAGEFSRPEIAYKDYLRGSEIAVAYIPRHHDYGFTYDNVAGWSKRQSTLMRSIKEMEPLVKDLRLIIEDDNARTGVRPNSAIGATPKVYDTGFGMPNASSAPPGLPLSGRTSPTSRLPASLQVGRQRPPVHPKREGLTSNPLQPPADDLSQRFSRLRASGNAPDLKMPNVEDYQNGVTSNLTNGYPSTRPNGPRDMKSPSSAPSVPPKLPLATMNFNMPKPPSPAYSPSKISTTPVEPRQNRASADSNRSAIEKRPTYYNQPITSAQLQRTRDENPYRPRTPNGTAIVSKNNSSDLPMDTSITAEKLAGHLRRYNVLLIDVRERHLFDEGHVFHSSILCIEPVSLREGVSAEELEERLVVSPDNEQTLFERRNEFDIVVYYDNNTNSTRYLSGPPTGSKTPALRALYDTLYEFNHYKPLRDGRPPALLLGGLDAWVDLMGSNSLQTSKTAATLGSTLRRPVQSTVRRRMVSQNSALEVRRKRMREYRPLNEDEEQAWRNKVQQEKVGTTEYVQEESEGDQGSISEGEPASPFIPDYEAFLRRFPEVNMQQSMTMPNRPAPPLPPYQHAAMPAIPSRPAPAIPRPSYSGQSEIIQPQASLARVTSATRPPLYSSQSVLRRIKLPRTGLTNFGVTCYMNSTLQCLSATTELSKFFLDDRYKQWVQKNWKGTQGIMPDIYAQVIRSLWKQDVEVIKPTTFRNFCGRMNREWIIDRQQDAKEFFDFLVDCLHEDLNARWSRTPLKPLTPAEESTREAMPVSRASPYEWERFQHRDFSFITSLFAGQHASRLRCKTCHNTSTTYEAFYSISIEIPRSGHGNIYDCLRHYTKEEMLSGDEVWKCPHCKCEREATKQIILTRLPQILVVHFKRFSASKTESARKIHTPIDFPIYGLRLDDFVVAKTPDVVGREQQDGGLKSELATTAPFSYDCYSVLRHLGNTMNGGHYVSLVRDQGRGDLWWLYDDDRVREVNVQQPQNSAGGGGGSRGERLQDERAYIVFYQRAPAR